MLTPFFVVLIQPILYPHQLRIRRTYYPLLSNIAQLEAYMYTPATIAPNPKAAKEISVGAELRAIKILWIA